MAELSSDSLVLTTPYHPTPHPRLPRPPLGLPAKFKTSEQVLRGPNVKWRGEEMELAVPGERPTFLLQDRGVAFPGCWPQQSPAPTATAPGFPLEVGRPLPWLLHTVVPTWERPPLPATGATLAVPQARAEWGEGSGFHRPQAKGSS